MGFTSTISSDTTLPVSASVSISRCASRKVSPPRTGVPTPGASSGSRASISRLTCRRGSCAASPAPARAARHAHPRQSRAWSAPACRTRAPLSRSAASSSRMPNSTSARRQLRAGRPMRVSSGAPLPQQHRQRHAVNVARRRDVGRIEIRHGHPPTARPPAAGASMADTVPMLMEWSPPRKMAGPGAGRTSALRRIQPGRRRRCSADGGRGWCRAAVAQAAARSGCRCRSRV